MNNKSEIRVKGMQAPIGALGLVNAERFMAANQMSAATPQQGSN